MAESKARWGLLQDQPDGLMFDAFARLPSLFDDCFPGVPTEKLATLGATAELATRWLSDVDSVVDDDLDPRDASTRALRIVARGDALYELLYSLFPADSRFWVTWRTSLRQYVDATTEQQEFRSRTIPWAAYDENTAMRVSRGTVAQSRALLSGMAVLAGVDTYERALGDSVVEALTARQLLDDLNDWREDRAAGVPTMVLALVEADGPASDDEIEARIISESAPCLLTHAQHCARLALDLARPAPCGLWREQVRQLIVRIDASQRALPHLTQPSPTEG